MDDELTISETQSVNLIAIDTISGCRSDASIDISDLTSFPEIILEPIQNLDCETYHLCDGF